MNTDALAFLAGGSEMGELTRKFDWSNTPLGPAVKWPQSLKTAVRIVLDSRYAMWLGWGPELIFFYNDAYARMTLGPRHPWALGRPAQEVWSEIWDDIGPRAESVVRTGQATWDEGLLLFVERKGFKEESYHTFSYSPLPDDYGSTGGMLCVVTEDTKRTIGERRLNALRELAARTTAIAKSVDAACDVAIQVLSEYPADIPFALIYLLDDNGRTARLTKCFGIESGEVGADTVVPLTSEAAFKQWPFLSCMQSKQALNVTQLEQRYGVVRCQQWPEPIQAARLIPLAKAGQPRLAGFLVAGVSPRLEFDADYQGFLDLVAGQVATAIANSKVYEEERERAEALARLDRAKTTFFSNVSHEFRTPLTLMLGPLQELLHRGDSDLSPRATEQLEIVSRNGQRLMRLVNSLLDFSRIEAGRQKAQFQPTDLSDLTADFASVFRSAIERAGLTFHVSCPQLREPVYVDREMWEKIVSNLLSNALKFTFAGEICLSLREVGNEVELDVRDTGTGIPVEEMPQLFERFHRIQNARGRTHEGSGIGLALVQELVKLHTGTISAHSRHGEGTTFTVRIPFGKEHLPANQIHQTFDLTTATHRSNPFVDDALQWLPEDDTFANGENSADVASENPSSRRSGVGNAQGHRPLILVADDNADMRRYIVRLLKSQFDVDTVSDGQAALDFVRVRRPDLILTDVMMPKLDGFGLLQKLRGDPYTRELPIIMLSARAGEESRVEGMEVGADDYLVKPFSSRELLARVTAHLQMAQLRRDARHALQVSHARFEALFAAAPIGIFLVDANLIIRQINPRALPVFGEIPNLIGCDLATVVQSFWHLDFALEIIKRFRETLQSGNSYHAAETLAERRDHSGPEYFELELHRIPLEDEQFGVVCYLRDISQQVFAQQELSDVDRRKDEFLATLAHELRNPLAPIRNSLQLLKLAGARPEIAENSRLVMERQIANMVRLIDDLLDISRINRGKILLQKSRVTLEAVLRNAIETSQPLIQESGLEFVTQIPDVPIYLNGDETRLSQCFTNLLNNAAKYTERGGKIRMSVQAFPKEVVVTIQDTGIGIPASMLSKIFEMFTQVDRSLEKSQGGLGIGLTIAKRLIEMHGGSIEAKSAGSGLGSQFIVKLPLAAAEARMTNEDAVVMAERSGSERKILVVDDNRDSAISLSMLLKLMGNETQTAHDGLEAIIVADAFRPDIILLDIGMPKLNGYDACRRIRENDWGKKMVIVALTGWGQDEDRRKSDEAGFDYHMVKPIDPAILEKFLAEVKSKKP